MRLQKSKTPHSPHLPPTSSTVIILHSPPPYVFLPPPSHQPSIPPSLPPCVPPLRRCSRQATGRLQRGGDSRGGVRSAAPAAGGCHLLPEQEEQAALRQEGQEGSGHWRGEQRHRGGDEDRQGQRRGRSPQQETVHRTVMKQDNESNRRRDEGKEESINEHNRANFYLLHSSEGDNKRWNVETGFFGGTLGGSPCLALSCFITWSRPFGWTFSFFFS